MRLKFLRLPISIGFMPCFRQEMAAGTLITFCSLVASCSVPHSIGLAERCADIMQRAYPSAGIDITKSEASATSLTSIVAKVEGVRTDTPPDNPLPRDLAVECQFDENILTGFRWTAGPTH